MAKDELSIDYTMLKRMAKELLEHQKKIRAMGMKIAKRSKNDAGYAIVEKLGNVEVHISKAINELKRAKKDLEML